MASINFSEDSFEEFLLWGNEDKKIQKKIKDLIINSNSQFKQSYLSIKTSVIFSISICAASLLFKVLSSILFDFL